MRLSLVAGALIFSCSLNAENITIGNDGLLGESNLATNIEADTSDNYTITAEKYGEINFNHKDNSTQITLSGDITNNGNLLLNNNDEGETKNYKNREFTGSLTNAAAHDSINLNKFLIDNDEDGADGFFADLNSMGYKLNAMIDGVPVNLEAGKQIINNGGLHIANSEIKNTDANPVITNNGNILTVWESAITAGSSNKAIEGKGDIILIDADIEGSTSGGKVYVLGTPGANDTPYVARKTQQDPNEYVTSVADLASTGAAKFESSIVKGALTTNTTAAKDNSLYAFNTTFEKAVDNKNGEATLILSDLKSGITSKGDIKIYGTTIAGDVSTGGKFISGAQQKELATEKFGALLKQESYLSAEQMKQVEAVMEKEENFVDKIKAVTKNSHSEIDETSFYTDALDYVDDEKITSGNLSADGGIDSFGFEMKGSGTVTVKNGNMLSAVDKYSGAVTITNGNLNATNSKFASTVTLNDGDLNALGNLLEKDAEGGYKEAMSYIGQDNEENYASSSFNDIEVKNGNIKLVNTYTNNITANADATTSKTIKLKNAVINDLTNGTNKDGINFNVESYKSTYGTSVVSFGDIIATSSVFDKDVKARNITISGIVDNVDRKDTADNVMHGEIAQNANIAAQNTLSLTGVQTTYSIATTPTANTTLLQAKTINLKDTILRGQAIGNAGINADLSTGILTEQVAAGSFYSDKISANSSINLDNSTVFGDLKADTIKFNGGKYSGRILANNLEANNATFLMGGSSSTFLGTMTARTSTNGANNEIGLLGLGVKDGKADITNMASLPLALLKIGTGTATAETFVTKVGAYNGLSIYTIDKKNLLSGTIEKDGAKYIYYSLITDADAQLEDTASQASERTSVSRASISRAAGDSETKVSDSFTLDTSKSSVDKRVLDKESLGVAAVAANADEAVAGTSQNRAVKNAMNNSQLASDTLVNNQKDALGATLTQAVENAKASSKQTAVENGATDVVLSTTSKEIQLVLEGANTKALDDAKTMLNQTYYSYVSEWNNLTKRMGELRDNDGKSAGVWFRSFGGEGKANNAKIKYIEAQFGVDKQTSLNEGELYTGLMANIGRSTSNAGDSKVNNYGFGAYASMLANNDVFVDATARITHHKAKFNDNIWLGDLKNSGTGFLASIEAGYKIGDEMYFEPSAELIMAYLPKVNLEGSNNIKLQAKSKFMSAAKMQLSAGAAINDTIALKASLGGAFDLVKSPTMTLSDSNISRTVDGVRDSRGFVNLGANVKLSKDARFNIDLEKSFGGKYNTTYNINATFRYSF